MSYTIDNAIIAVIISAAVSSIFWFVKEKKLDPEKWKKDAKKETMLKQIESYGKILVFLNSARERRKNFTRETKHVSKESTHLFFFPGDVQDFNDVFRENLPLCSDNILGLYNEFMNSDKTFLFSSMKWKSDQPAWIQAFDITKIHDAIQKEYDMIRNEYEKLTGYSIN